jgi:hypothetical protein
MDRSEFLGLRLTPKERAMIETLARSEGESMSVVLRRLVRQAVMAGQTGPATPGKMEVCGNGQTNSLGD